MTYSCPGDLHRNYLEITDLKNEKVLPQNENDALHHQNIFLFSEVFAAVVVVVPDKIK